MQIDLENRSVTTANGTFELPPKEFDLLLYCAKHQGKILTKQQIYEEVWGEEYFYDDSNIMAIISRLRKKLEVNPSSPKYIQTVKGIGYRFNKEVLGRTPKQAAKEEPRPSQITPPDSSLSVASRLMPPSIKIGRAHV